MRRSPRVVLAWIAAVVVALLTVQIVWSDLDTLHRRARTLGRDVGVALATRDLPVGTMLTAADLHVVTRPASVVPADTVHDAHAAIGRVVAVAMVRDDIVRAAHLAGATGAGIDGVVTPGRRAVHVVMKDGFRPPPGAVVDVLATYDTAGTGAAGARATVVAAGARVLQFDDPGDGDTSATGVTVLVRDTEARAVAYAASAGQITLVLAPPQSACCAPDAGGSGFGNVGP